jgi:hypothetical protein
VQVAPRGLRIVRFLVLFTTMFVGVRLMPGPPGWDFLAGCVLVAVVFVAVDHALTRRFAGAGRGPPVSGASRAPRGPRTTNSGR